MLLVLSILFFFFPLFSGILFGVFTLLDDHVDRDSDFELHVLAFFVGNVEFEGLILLVRESETARLPMKSRQSRLHIILRRLSSRES